MRGKGRTVSETHSRGFMVTLGLVGVLILVALVWVGYTAPNKIPGRSYYNLVAEFGNADNLTTHYSVRVGGREVGQVLHPRVEDGKAVVDLQLDAAIKPLLSDTRLRVRPRSAIGVRFVELHPGKSGRPLDEGARIPASQTSATLPLDAFLDVFDSPTREHTQILLRELGTGLLDRGEDLGAAVGDGGKMLADTAAFAAAMTSRPGALPRFVTATNGAFAAFDAARDDIAGAFGPAARALRPMGDHGDALQRALDEAPRAFTALRRNLTAADPFVEELGALARGARPALGEMPAAFSQTAALLRDARPGLRDFDKTLRLADRAMPSTIRLFQSLSPFMPLLEDFMRTLSPLLAELARRDCDLSRFMKNWASAFAYGDERSNVLRLRVAPQTSFSGEPYPEPCVNTAGTR